MKISTFFLLTASPALAGFSPLFTIGENDGSYGEFANDNANLDPAPGSATTADDHYYLAGTYPAPIGVVTENEPVSNFERDFANSDNRNIVYFNLTASQATSTGILRVISDFVRSGNNNGGEVGNIISISVNGHPAFTSGIFGANTVITAEFPTTGLNLVTGANQLEISRSGGTTNSYLTFDQLSAHLDPLALRDDDNDGLPQYWEQQNLFSDNDPADASADPDRDLFTNLQEFQKRTNPRITDTDHDGLSDSAETVTDPRNPDSDGDGLLDGEETTSDPTLADSDADGAPDAWEIQTGYLPSDNTSTPPAWGGAIALNFRSDDNLTKGIWPNDCPNGIVPQINWNQTTPLRDYGVSSGDPLLTGDTSDIAQPSPGILVDSNGDATTATITFSHDGVRTNDTAGSKEAGIFHGYLANDDDFPSTLAVSNLPASFGTYDIYVYLSANYQGPLATIRLNNQFLNDVLVRPQASGALQEFRLFQSTTGPAVPGANVVRFTNQTARSFSIQDFRTNATSGIAALQIVDVSTDADHNSIPDSWQVQHGMDATTEADPDGDGLDWLAEFLANAHPHRADTDGDGLTDGEEVTAGSKANDPDSDDDGLSDFDELHHPLPSNPILADSDNDGLNDKDERSHFSDPMDPAINHLPIPTYPAAGQVLWEMTNLQFVKNHGDGIESDSGTNRDFIDWRVSNITTDTDTALRMRIPLREGRMIPEVYTNSTGAFSRNGSSRTANTTNADLAKALGFAGFGNCDTSDPLTFRMLATDNGNPVDNWDLVYTIVNQRTSTAVATLSIDQCEIVPSLSDQTASWGASPVPGMSYLRLSQGLRLFRTTTPVEQLKGFEHCADADNDGMSDAFETQYGLNPNSAADAALDGDSDGLSNLLEAILGSAPNKTDTDDDGVPDFVEAHQFTDPNSASSKPPLFTSLPGGGADLNGNGMSDLWESQFGATDLNPALDADSDGLSNLDEAGLGTDPFDATSGFKLRLEPSPGPDAVTLFYPKLTLKNQELEMGVSLADFGLSDLTPSLSGNDYTVEIPFDLAREFFRVRVSERDTDFDGLSDWDESILGSSSGNANSLARPVPHDSTGDGNPDTGIDGDYAVFLERFANQLSLSTGNGSAIPTRIDAARLLMQATFGPTMEEIHKVRELGLEAWIDDQINVQPATHHRDYITEIQADLNGPRLDRSYLFNSDETSVGEENLQTSFARAAISGPDQLRQRVAFALSQILVISRQDGTIDQNINSLAAYYDRLVDHAFGNYYDILLGVTLDPNMGRYLSHVGNQPPAPEINRYPDENYAREVMQLFSIGLWELNQDGTRKVDPDGNFIQTYRNEEITEMARVMTGLWFANNDWGSQNRQDSEHLAPMELHPDYHDFGEKTLLNGFVIPARSPNAENGMQDIRDAIRHLFEHPNCAPFISRSLIQFLVTSNPSPAFVARMSAVFANNGNGIRGDLGALVKAILLDPEARDPAIATSPKFGIFREPVIRTMHLARLTHINRNGDAVWWDYGNFYEDALQMPLFSPSVFNFYRPDYSPPGTLDREGLDGPAFEITNSYTTVSFANRLWNIADQGFDMGSRYKFTPDYRDMMPYLANPDTLLDYLNLVVCSGQMSAGTRNQIKAALASTATSDPVEIVKLAVYLTIVSPEGSVQR
ncbi:DUF1800 family protein [Verrucomicrobiaceae bacterium 227]